MVVKGDPKGPFLIAIYIYILACRRKLWNPEFQFLSRLSASHIALIVLGILHTQLFSYQS